MNFTNCFFKIKNNFHRNSIGKWKINNKKNPGNHTVRHVFWPSNSKFCMSQYEKKPQTLSLYVCTLKVIFIVFQIDIILIWITYILLSTLLVTLSSQKKMNEKLLLTIPNKKIFSDNSSQTHSAEKLGKNVYAKKTRQMKWINFTEYTFQFPWPEFVFKKVNLIQNSLNWFHKFFFLAWTFKNFLTCCEKPTNSISESRITHNHVFAVQKADLVATYCDRLYWNFEQKFLRWNWLQVCHSLQRLAITN